MQLTYSGSLGSYPVGILDRPLTVPTRILLAFTAVFLSGSLCTAQNFVYTNNNNYFAPNTVSGYLVKANGVVVEVKGSPFQTGGEGNGANGYIAANRITVCKKFLFASNGYSGNISGFAINPLTGHLKVVSGSPFTVNGVDSEGIPVAISSDCKFVFAGDLNNFRVFAFHVSPTGTLTPVKGSPFSVPWLPGTLKLSNHNKFLAVALNDVGVGMYTIGSNGSLQAVAGSPFPASQNSEGYGDMEMSCATSFLYLPETFNKIDIFSIASSGALALIAGSPFPSPANNVIAVLSPNGHSLFTSNDLSGVNGFRVVAGGGTKSVPGSPFNAQLVSSGGLSINKAGTLLFVADYGGTQTQFSVMKVNRKGSLTLAPGSPVSTGQDGGMFSLTAYPPKACVAPERSAFFSDVAF
jgi:hypothetical protein